GGLVVTDEGISQMEMLDFPSCFGFKTFSLMVQRTFMLNMLTSISVDLLGFCTTSKGSVIMTSVFSVFHSILAQTQFRKVDANHLCFTWSSCTGAAVVFVDGRKSLTKIYKQGHSIRPGGRIILGQDPDQLLGGFNAEQSFVGEITDVNLWDFVLPEQQGGSMEGGNVIDWDWADLEENGEVEIINALL
uniref:Pentraxin family member n=1 Tax=Poecilia reticulata TaxID=8081 RepID=A0A3P9MU44_POERE